MARDVVCIKHFQRKIVIETRLACDNLHCTCKELPLFLKPVEEFMKLCAHFAMLDYKTFPCPCEVHIDTESESSTFRMGGSWVSEGYDPIANEEEDWAHSFDINNFASMG